MANINQLLARAAALRDETALNSISPERAGGIMYDTLVALNELWLQQGAALVISKIYASVAAMQADTAPVSDLTGQPLRPGQIVVIASSDSDNGTVYRYNGTSSPSWSAVGSIGGVEPVDSLDSDSTILPLTARQGKVLDGKINQLGQEVNGVPAATTESGVFSTKFTNVGTAGYDHLIMPVIPGTLVVIEGAANQKTDYGFLKTHQTPVNQLALDYAGGQTDRLQLTAGETKTLTVPSDAYYMITSKTYNGGNRAPQSVVSNGIDLLNGDRGLAGDISALVTKIGDIEYVLNDTITEELADESKTFSGTGSNINNWIPVPFKNGLKYRVTIDESTSAENVYAIRVYKSQSVAASELVATIDAECPIDSKKHIYIYDCASTEAQYINVQSKNSISGTTYSFRIIVETYGAIAQLEDRVSVLEESTAHPSYFDNAISTAIGVVRGNNLLSGKNGDSLCVITDIHFPDGKGYGPQIASLVAKKTNNKILVHGGDFITTNNTKSEFISILQDYMYNIQLCFGDNYRALYGNHDNNAQDEQGSDTEYLPESDFYSLVFKGFENQVENPGANLYYYWDNPNQKIRYVCFNSGVAGASAIMSPQFAWFKGLVDNAPSGYRFVVFIHMVWNNSSEAWASSSLHDLMDIFDAVNTRSSIDVGSTTYDFTGADVEVSAVITGHIHSGYSGTYGTSSIPIVCLSSDRSSPAGAVTEHRIHFLDIDYTNRKLYIYTLGKDSGNTNVNLATI